MPELLLALDAATSDLLSALSGLSWSSSDVAAASLCSGWTRGHVLTHVARNADGIADTISGALRGEIVERYPGGWDARNAAISAGASRPFAALVSDVRSSASRLSAAFSSVASVDGWELPTADHETPASWVFRRLREVVVHHVDLAAAYTPADWPAAYVSLELGDAAASLGSRVTSGAVLVRVTAEGSVTSDYVGREWLVGSGAPTEVSGPDWAVLAWLIGRPSAAASALSATPALGPWG